MARDFLSIKAAFFTVHHQGNHSFVEFCILQCNMGIAPSNFSGKSLVSMLQLLCNTFIKGNGLNANMSLSTGLVVYTERSDYGYAASSIVATIVIIICRYYRESSSPNFEDV